MTIPTLRLPRHSISTAVPSRAWWREEAVAQRGVVAGLRRDADAARPAAAARLHAAADTLEARIIVLELRGRGLERGRRR